MPREFEQNLEKEKFEKELEERLAREEELEEEYGRVSLREQRAGKEKLAPKGGTLGAQIKGLRERKFHIRSRKKPKIRIIDLTNK